MATTNHTPTIELSQYISTDKTSYLVNYNDDMLKIDSAIAADRDNINTAQNTADTAEGKADTNKLSIDAINETLNDNTTGVLKRLGDVEGDVNTIESLIGNGEPTTTDKTIIGAINELVSNNQSLGQKINNKYLIVADDVDLAVVTADGVKTIPELLNDLASAFITNCGTLATDERYEVIGMFAGGFGFLQSRNMILSTNALSAYGEEFTFTFVDPVAAKIESTHIKCDSTAANCFWRYGRVYDDSGVCKITTVADTSVPASGTKYTLTGRKLKIYD